jgi:chemotaxis protein CheZ
MALSRKLFRIEQMAHDNVPPAEDDATPDAAAAAPAAPAMPAHSSPDARRHDELLAEIRSLKAMFEPRTNVNHVSEAQRLIETYHAQIAEMHKLKAELIVIQNAITQTKQEIATVHITGFHGEEMSRVTHELDAVVDGTEQATQRILNMVEDIDQFASNLLDNAKDEGEKEIARAIQERVVQVFEACNFQDLTGQRITKVVSTWKFIETHVARMMDIWGGLDAFKEFIPEAPPEREGDAKLLNGPKLAGDEGHASQDDIDALFN